MSTPKFFGVVQKRNYQDDATEPGMRFSVKHRSPTGLPLQPTDTLYIGNMQFDTTEQELQDYFSTIGEISAVKIIHDPKGLSKG